MTVGNASEAEKASQDAEGNNIPATYLKQNGDASNTTVKFTQASDRANIMSGEGLKTIFGKIKKWLADLKTVAFTGAYSDLSGAPSSLPASGGHADIADEVVAIKPNQVTTNTILDSSIPGGKLVSDITLPGTPQVGTPSGLNGASQNVATVGNVNAAITNMQIGGTNIYRDTLGTSDFYISSTGEMKYRRFLDITDEAKRNLRGQSIAVSFDYIFENVIFGAGDNGFGFFVKYTDGTTTYVNAFIPAETSPVTKSGRFLYTVKIEDKEIDNITSFQPFMYAQTTSGTATVGRPKFEIGTKATQWSPAPEEMARKSELETAISNIPAGNVRFSTGDSFEELYDRGELKGQPGETGPKGDKGDTGPSGLEAIGIRLKVDQGALYWSPESSGDVWHKIADSNNTHFGG